MNRADLVKAISAAPTMRGTLAVSAVVSTVFHVVAGDPWVVLPFRIAVACAVGALICWGWQRLARS
jgi:hypothetical protein